MVTTSIYAVRDALLLAGIRCHFVWQNYGSHNAGIPEGINFWADNAQKYPAATLWRPGAALRYGVGTQWIWEMDTAEPDTPPVVLAGLIGEWLKLEGVKYG